MENLTRTLKFIALFFCSTFFFANHSYSQCPVLPEGPDEANIVRFDKFLGVNLRRADPIDFASCVGSVREYHNWDIDEASNCYKIIYKFDDPVDDISWDVKDSDQNVVAQGGPYEINPDWRVKAFFCPPKEDMYTLTVYSADQDGIAPGSFELWEPDTYNNPLFETSGNFGSQTSYSFNVSNAEFQYPNNGYEWHPANAGESSIVSFDNFYQELNGLGLDICGTLMLGARAVSSGEPNSVHPPSYLVENDDYCNDPTVLPDDPLNLLGYRWRADYLTQYANRYGSGGALGNAADKHLGNSASAAGMGGSVGYLESWNEQDATWWIPGTSDPIFSPEEYATMVSVEYDGHGGTMSAEKGCPGSTGYTQYPLGVNGAMKFVMGGTSTIDREYLECMVEWFEINRAGMNPVIPFDVLNFHNYAFVSFDGYSALGPGISPEAYALYDKLKEMDEIRDKMDQSFELWLSEFGYNTNPPDGGSNTAIAFSVPELVNGTSVSDRYEVQGQWNARTFLIAAAADFDKAFVYEIRDGANLDNDLASWDYRCGIVESADEGYQPKKSWYYTYTMKNVLEGMDFGEIKNHGDPDAISQPVPAVYKFKGVDDPSKTIYAVWSPTSVNISPYNFSLTFDETATTASVVRMEVPSTTGIWNQVDVNSNTVEVSVSERPIFIVLDEVEQVVACPANLEIFNISCSSVNITWEIPNNQVYDHYQLWYGPVGNNPSTNDIPDPNNPDIYQDNITLFDGDIPGNVTQAVIGGLQSSTNYAFYVIGIGDNNSSDWCIPAVAETTEEGCNIYIDKDNVTPLNPDGTAWTGSPATDQLHLSYLVDDQNDSNFDIDCCSLPEDDGYTTWQSFGEDVKITLDTYYDLDFIYIFDGNGVSHLFFDYWDEQQGEWVEFTDYVTSAYLKWHTIANEAPPCQPIKELRIRSAQQKGKIDEIVLCGKPAPLNPLPEADFTFVEECGRVMFMSDPSTDSPAFTHEWYFGDDPVNPSFSAEINPTFDYPESGSYEVTHIVTNSCGQSFEIKTVVTNVDCNNTCACANGYNIGDGGSITLTNSGIPLTDDILEMSCISVNGQLVIDRKFTFENVIFKMLPDAEIIIDGDGDKMEVNIYNSILEGCEQMWRGIDIINRAVLDFEGNSIYDAEYAIYPTDDTKIRIVDNDFISNFVGVGTGPVAPGDDYQYIKQNDGIFDNRFECPDFLKKPKDDQKSYAAFSIFNTNQFVIGDNNEAPNDIRDSYYGIRIQESSECEIDNNKIEDLSTGYANFNAGIWLSGSNGIFMKKNEINNVQRGLHSQFSEYHFYDNEVDLTGVDSEEGTGIYSYFGFNQEINENSIIAKEPIFIWGNESAASDEWDVNIHDNPNLRIVSGFPANPGNPGFGIALFRGSGNANIENNYILGDKMNTGITGISAHIWEGESRIYNNRVDISANVPSTNGTSGISISVCDGFQVVDNEINHYDEAGIFPEMNSAIIANNNSNMFYCCNKVDNARIGVLFGGANSDVDFNSTTYQRHSRSGFVLANSIIGEQLGSGNDWSSSVNDNHAEYIGNPSFIFFSPFHSDANLWPFPSGQIEDKIQVPAGVDPEDWFKFPGNDILCIIELEPNATVACGVDLTESEIPEPPVFITPVDIEVAKSTESNSAVVNGVNFELKRQLYLKLGKDPSLINSDYNLQIFYAEQQQSPIGFFHDFDNTLKESSNIEIQFGNDVSYAKIELEQLKIEIENLKNALDFAGSATSNSVEAQLGNKILLQGELSSFINEKIETIKNGRLTVIEQLDNLNGSVEAKDVYEINQKSFNQLYLQLLLNDELSLTQAQKTILDDLAFQCYYSGGRAVLQARALQIFMGEYYDYALYDSDCEPETEKREIGGKLNVSIYPNPSDAKFVINLGEELSSALPYKVISGIGEVIRSNEISSKSRKFTIDLEGEEPGVYYIELNGYENSYLTKKIILLPR